MTTTPHDVAHCQVLSLRSGHGAELRAGTRTEAPRMRDIEVIDSELRLLLAIRRMIREAEGPAAEHRAHRRTAG
jgi:hypothetical protein